MQENRILTALMDEYRRVAEDLKELLAAIPQDEFERIADHDTQDPDCRSIQTVISHVVGSGYTYANYINGLKSKPWINNDNSVNSPEEGIFKIETMLNFTESAFGAFRDDDYEQLATYSINSRWGVVYDFEQMIEHAIVHILRHRRQIENFLNS